METKLAFNMEKETHPGAPVFGIVVVISAVLLTIIFAFTRLYAADCSHPQAADACRVDQWPFCRDVALVFIVSFALALALRRLGRGTRYTRIARFVTLTIALALPAYFMYAALLHNPQEEFCRYVGNAPGDMLARLLGQQACSIAWHSWIMIGVFAGVFTLPLNAAIWWFIDRVREPDAWERQE